MEPAATSKIPSITISDGVSKSDISIISNIDKNDDPNHYDLNEVIPDINIQFSQNVIE